MTADSSPLFDPRGAVVIRTIAMPADANPNGDIFGGWLLAQMDLGGAVLARGIACSRVVTVAVDAMSFVTPVNVGDIITCYARVEGIGRTSLKIAIQAWVTREPGDQERHVTHGHFSYVAIDERGKPHPVKQRELPTTLRSGRKRSRHGLVCSSAALKNAAMPH